EPAGRRLRRVRHRGRRCRPAAHDGNRPQRRPARSPTWITEVVALRHLFLATIRSVFTVAQRDDLAQNVLRLADNDDRVVAGAIVGSLAVGGGDRFSDLDLTFGVADPIPITEVLDDWTRALTKDFGAVRLADLE